MRFMFMSREDSWLGFTISRSAKRKKKSSCVAGRSKCAHVSTVGHLTTDLQKKDLHVHLGNKC